ncbi:MAG: MarR family transcriptional regulator [Parasporobacterium sp.]|nr:MarR family transcriptional regulator [Parasporobacterium sp.]
MPERKPSGDHNNSINTLSFESCINYLLTNAQRRTHAVFSKGLEEFNVTPGQSAVLEILWTCGDQTPSFLASQLKLELPTLSGVLDKLQKKGFINRIINQENQRTIIVSLTEAGKLLEDPIKERVAILNNKLLKGINDTDRELLFNILNYISSFKDE